MLCMVIISSFLNNFVFLTERFVCFVTDRMVHICDQIIEKDSPQQEALFGVQKIMPTKK